MQLQPFEAKLFNLAAQHSRNAPRFGLRIVLGEPDEPCPGSGRTFRRSPVGLLIGRVVNGEDDAAVDAGFLHVAECDPDVAVGSPGSGHLLAQAGMAMRIDHEAPCLRLQAASPGPPKTQQELSPVFHMESIIEELHPKINLIDASPCACQATVRLALKYIC